LLIILESLTGNKAEAEEQADNKEIIKDEKNNQAIMGRFIFKCPQPGSAYL